MAEIISLINIKVFSSEFLNRNILEEALTIADNIIEHCQFKSISIVGLYKSHPNYMGQKKILIWLSHKEDCLKKLSILEELKIYSLEVFGHPSFIDPDMNWD